MPTLDWLNREQALAIANAVLYRLLEHISSHGDPAAFKNDGQGGDVRAQVDRLIAAT
jgi:hypothetical protein